MSSTLAAGPVRRPADEVGPRLIDGVLAAAVAAAAAVVVRSRGGTVELTIAGDGRGTATNGAPSVERSGRGLPGMGERIGRGLPGTANASACSAPVTGRSWWCSPTRPG